jgi:hypothetical protein
MLVAVHESMATNVQTAPSREVTSQVRRRPHRSSSRTSPFGSIQHNTTVHPSFNGKLRDESLGREVFDTRLEATVLIERWRRESNSARPHRSPGPRPPAPTAYALISVGPGPVTAPSRRWRPAACRG